MSYILDGLIRNDSIIEVKCPYSAKDYPTIEEAINDKKVWKYIIYII